MKAKLGMSPIAWWNDDLVELSDDVSLEECLRQSRSAGFTGMEMGRRFPSDPAVMLPILKAADVTLCGGWFSGTLVDESLETAPFREIDRVHWPRNQNSPATR
jgi:inosose dehydratase